MKTAFVFLLLTGLASGYLAPSSVACARRGDKTRTQLFANHKDQVGLVKSAGLIAALSLQLALANPICALAAEDGTQGASTAAGAKIQTGGASTLQSGRTIAITRGVNLDRSDFSNQNLKGVAFQQSIVRDANFKNSNLFSASFFDATLDGSDFENCDMSQVNFEMAQLNRANFKNAVVKEAYVGGTTLFEGVKSIENSDWSETYLRADQKKYLCAHPTAKGTNPTTGADTRESLMCID
ncbi:hypothetical protein TrVE_jg3555 [Triparma verrucosa]|uniref:Pentapeptide repeat-containing protein n=1 Tax=Triparma verrucosa TaxID=1606542 RepID=A0A9W7FP11_9STRA|nr:hypothetical protein TrVE_jg3555 [Triparma verrucosa]